MIGVEQVGVGGRGVVRCSCVCLQVLGEPLDPEPLQCGSRRAGRGTGRARGRSRVAGVGVVALARAARSGRAGSVVGEVRRGRRRARRPGRRTTRRASSPRARCAAAPSGSARPASRPAPARRPGDTAYTFLSGLPVWATSVTVTQPSAVHPAPAPGRSAGGWRARRSRSSGRTAWPARARTRAARCSATSSACSRAMRLRSVIELVEILPHLCNEVQWVIRDTATVAAWRGGPPRPQRCARCCSPRAARRPPGRTPARPTPGPRLHRPPDQPGARAGSGPQPRPAALGGPARTQPLVLAVNARRPPIDLAPRLARRVARRDGPRLGGARRACGRADRHPAPGRPAEPSRPTRGRGARVGRSARRARRRRRRRRPAARRRDATRSRAAGREPGPGHHAHRRRRHHARPPGRRAGRGGGRPGVPAPADAAPPRAPPTSPSATWRARCRRTAAHPGRRLVRRRPARCAPGCGRPGSTRSAWPTTTPATTATRALVQTVRPAARGAGLRPFGAGADLAAGAAAGGGRAARRPLRLPRRSTRSARRRRSAPGRPGAISVSMPPRTGPLDRAELDRSSATCAASTAGWTWSPCCRTGARSTPSARSRSRSTSAGELVARRRRPRRRRAPALGAGRLAASATRWSCTRWATSSSTWTSCRRRRRGWCSRRRSGATSSRPRDFVPYRIGADFAPRVVPHGAARADRSTNFWRFSGLGASPR